MQKRLKELLCEKAHQVGVEILEMEIMLDHVHLFVRTRPQTAPYWIVKHLKGYPLVPFSINMASRLGDERRGGLWKH